MLTMGTSITAMAQEVRGNGPGLHHLSGML